MRILARLMVVMALVLLWAPTWAQSFSESTQDGPVVVVARVEGTIDTVNAQYLARVLDHARSARAAAVVIEMDTPGGTDTAMRRMTQHMLASPVPTIVYVSPSGARAGSAGVFIAMAADVAAMAPGTNIGAAHPVALGGGEIDKTMSEKITNDAAAYIRTLAEAKKHNADWGEKAVRESASITENQALDLKVIDVVARDLPGLLEEVSGRQVTTGAGPMVLATRGAPIERVPMSFAESVLHVLIDPNIAYLLLSIGTIGIIAELYHPGMWFPGITGVIALILAFVGLDTLPTNWGGVALIGLAMLLFILELYVPSHGILAIGGVAAFVLGSLLLYTPLAPTAPVFPGVGVSPWLIALVTALIAGFFLIVIRAAVQVHRRRRKPAEGLQLETLVGATGVATTDLAPNGTAQMQSELWSATADGETIRAGETVEVVAVEGLRLKVRKAQR